MKLLTKEQEQEHYNATLKGGAFGGAIGLVAAGAGVAAASMRYPFFRNLTLPLKAFLVTSGGTFAGIVAADHASRSYEQERNPIDREYKERERQQYEADIAGKTFTQRAMEWGKKERYKIVGVSWIASMATAFALVNRDKYLTGAQKLVQARVYAQFLTLGVLIASAAFEISDSRSDSGRWETKMIVDPNDPEHKRMIEKRYEKSGTTGGSGDQGASNMWKDMVAAEEERMKDREEEEKRLRKKYGSTKPSTSTSTKSEGGKKKKPQSSKDDEEKPDKKQKQKEQEDQDEDAENGSDNDDNNEKEDEKPKDDEKSKDGEKSKKDESGSKKEKKSKK